MIRSALLNAFVILKRKPMVLLLLFPFYSIAPLAFLLFPAIIEKTNDESTAPLILLAMLIIILAVLFIIIARAILLIPPAMELLHDGAEGAETPAGWYARGLKKHWWKRISLGVVERAASTFLSMLFQIVFSVFMPLLALSNIDNHSNGSSPSAAVILTIILCAGLYIFMLLVLFLLESISAFLLAAMADRSIGAAFRAVFSRLGMRKFLKLLGGRLLIGIISIVIIVVFYIALSTASVLGTLAFDSSDIGSMIPFVCILSFILFLVSYIEVYRFAFDFCVFQQFKDSEGSKDGIIQNPLMKQEVL